MPSFRPHVLCPRLVAVWCDCDCLLLQWLGVITGVIQIIQFSWYQPFCVISRLYWLICICWHWIYYFHLAIPPGPTLDWLLHFTFGLILTQVNIRCCAMMLPNDMHEVVFKNMKCISDGNEIFEWCCVLALFTLTKHPHWLFSMHNNLTVVIFLLCQD